MIHYGILQKERVKIVLVWGIIFGKKEVIK